MLAPRSADPAPWTGSEIAIPSTSFGVAGVAVCNAARRGGHRMTPTGMTSLVQAITGQVDRRVRTRRLNCGDGSVRRCVRTDHHRHRPTIARPGSATATCVASSPNSSTDLAARSAPSRSATTYAAGAYRSPHRHSGPPPLPPRRHRTAPRHAAHPHPHPALTPRPPLRVLPRRVARPGRGHPHRARRDHVPDHVPAAQHRMT